MAVMRKSKAAAEQSEEPKTRPARRAKVLTLKRFAEKTKFMEVQTLSMACVATSTTLTDSNFPIHSIFAPDNWKPNLTVAKYNAIKPSLHHTSRFLTSKQLRPILNTMLHPGALQSLGEMEPGRTENPLETYTDAKADPDQRVTPTQH